MKEFDNNFINNHKLLLDKSLTSLDVSRQWRDSYNTMPYQRESYAQAKVLYDRGSIMRVNFTFDGEM